MPDNLGREAAARVAALAGPSLIVVDKWLACNGASVHARITCITPSKKRQQARSIPGMQIADSQRCH